MDIKRILRLNLIILFTTTYLLSFNLFAQQVKVTVGADILVSDSLHLIQNNRLGIVTNHSAILRNGTHLVDTLISLPNINVTTLFGPEHEFGAMLRMVILLKMVLIPKLGFLYFRFMVKRENQQRKCSKM